MFTVTGKVVATKRVGTSTMGNPTFMVTLDNGEMYRTMSNTSLAYAIENPEYRDRVHVFTLTKAGRIRSAMTVARYLATTEGKDAEARRLHNEDIKLQPIA